MLITLQVAFEILVKADVGYTTIVTMVFFTAYTKF